MSTQHRGKYERRADNWGPGTHRELLEFVDELACDADAEVDHWKRKALKLGEKLRSANLDLRTCPYCGQLCGEDPKGTRYQHQNLHRWHFECWQEMVSR